ncbi:hypothetical protein [Neptunomonas phycophila]|uniref:hypothetical protein n=1 Tax=Neptunomonas phycophila TaxID=1572645 RepID=UPI00094908CF|nr:hypothetical protein [Neptunomonas phycophila]
MEYLSTPENFFLELPLYQPIKWDGDDEQVFRIAELLHYQDTIDCFCLECNKDSTFSSKSLSMPKELTIEDYRRRKTAASLVSPGSRSANRVTKISLPKIGREIIDLSFECTRNPNHRLLFIYSIKDLVERNEGEGLTRFQQLEKIGQTPSFAALNQPEIKKYRSILKDKYGEFSRAIGLASHDIGIGAYVYLRRIFESLLLEAKVQAVSNGDIDETEYLKMKVSERIKALKGHLPTFLVEHSNIYSVLSKGIHELDEKECLQHFNTLKIGIELILDQKIEEREKKRKIEEASRAINEASGKLKNL